MKTKLIVPGIAILLMLATGALCAALTVHQSPGDTVEEMSFTDSQFTGCTPVDMEKAEDLTPFMVFENVFCTTAATVKTVVPVTPIPEQNDISRQYSCLLENKELLNCQLLTALLKNYEYCSYYSKERVRKYTNRTRYRHDVLNNYSSGKRNALSNNLII